MTNGKQRGMMKTKTRNQIRNHENIYIHIKKKTVKVTFTVLGKLSLLGICIFSGGSIIYLLPKQDNPTLWYHYGLVLSLICVCLVFAFILAWMLFPDFDI